MRKKISDTTYALFSRGWCISHSETGWIGYRLRQDLY